MNETPSKKLHQDNKPIEIKVEQQDDDEEEDDNEQDVSAQNINRNKDEMESESSDYEEHLPVMVNEDQQSPQPEDVSHEKQEQQKKEEDQQQVENQQMIKIEQHNQQQNLQFQLAQQQLWQKQHFPQLKQEKIEEGCEELNYQQTILAQQQQQQQQQQSQQLPLILQQASLSIGNNPSPDQIAEYLAQQAQIYKDNPNNDSSHNMMLLRSNNFYPHNVGLPYQTGNTQNNANSFQPEFNQLGLENLKSNNNESQQHQQQLQLDFDQQQAALQAKIDKRARDAELRLEIRHRKGTKEQDKLEKQLELTQFELQKRMQFHNQLKIFMLQGTKYIKESFEKDKTWYGDEIDMKNKHLKYLMFFKNRFTKSDLSYFLQNISPITGHQLDELVNKTKGRKQLLAQRRIIFIIIILSSFLSSEELQLIIGEESRRSEFLRQSNTELTQYLIYNQDKLVLINDHITTVNRFNKINRMLLQRFCLFHSGQCACKKKASKIDQFYCKNYVLTMLANPERIE